MTREPVTAEPSEDLLSCAKKMVRKKVGSLLIVEGKKLVGFLSQRDILWALVKKSKKDLSSIKAIHISPKKIMTIKPTADIQEAIKRMNKFKFDRLPVIDNGEVVGIVTVKDILSFQPEVYPELEELSKIREESEKLKRIKKAKEKTSSHEGICEECGSTEILYRVHGMLICESCKNSI
jgi:signal-transduction protein with cAMP-binding, CBS, and nucleotidyltransferase domain